MFILSKVFTYLFLPPGIFIILLLIATLYSNRFRSLMLLSAISLYLISIKPISNIILEPLEQFDLNETSNPTAVVFLGGGTNSNDLIKAEPDAFKREVYALALAKKNNLPLIFSGKGVSNVSEANNTQQDIVFLSKAFDFKVETYYENQSLNTWQNAKYTSELFDKIKIQKEIILVTSAYHTKRAAMMFKHFGYRVNTKSIGKFTNYDKEQFEYFPNMQYMCQSYKAIHEYLGLLFFAFRQLF